MDLEERMGVVPPVSSTPTGGCPPPVPKQIGGTNLRVHLLQRVEEGYKRRAPEMGDGAQPREQALVQHLLEVSLADVLEERSAHVRRPSRAWRPPHGWAWHGAHQHGGAQVELLGQLRDVDVHGDQLVLVCLLHLADDVCQPLELPLCVRVTQMK